MNTHSEMVDASATAVRLPDQLLLNHRVLGFTLALWLGGSALLDFIVMPTLYFTGMIDSGSFASAGASLFLTFNNLEIILGAIVLAAVLAHRHEPNVEAHRSIGGLGLPLVMLTVALLYRYLLTPQIAGMGLQLDWMTDATIPVDMMIMHAGYWLLESVKLTAGIVLLNRCFRMPI